MTTRPMTRPMTNYARPVACPQCGQHRPKDWDQRESRCIPCVRTGHLYRLMGAEEMAWCAVRDREAGYSEVADRRERIASSLREVSDES